MALSRAGLNRLTPGATAVLLLAANVPDIDLASAAFGSLTYLNYHRHLTHALVMAPVMALLPLLLVRLAMRKPVAWVSGFLISLAGVASHLALDLTNAYGIRLLLPFSARWLRLDINSVIDPWILVALLLAVVAPAFSQLIGSEIGEKKRPGRAAAALALVFLILYSCGRGVLHQRALAILDSRIYDGSPPRSVAAFPTVFNPFLWRGLVTSASSTTLFDLNISVPFDAADGRVFYAPEDREYIRIASGTVVFQDFLAFSQFPVWTITPLPEPAGGVKIEVTDLRFGAPSRRGFTATAILDGQRRVVRSWFQFL